MAAISKVNDIQARKRALVTESEVYREMLKLEAQNLQLYSLRMQRRFSKVAKLAPLLLLAKPAAGLLFARRKPARRGWIGTAFLGWRLYRQFAPTLGLFLQRFAGRKSRQSSIRQD